MRVCIGERLRNTERGAVSKGRSFIVFDEDGKTQVVDVVGVIKDSDARRHVRLDKSYLGSEEKISVRFHIYAKADKFAGNRLVLTASLFDVQSIVRYNVKYSF